MGENGAVGNRDIAAIAQAFADPRRVRVLTALGDGRALPAGRLAEEAGIRVFAQFVDSGWITGGDGMPIPTDEISSVGHGLQHRLSENGASAFADWGVDAGLLSTSAPRSQTGCSTSGGSRGDGCPAVAQTATGCAAPHVSKE